MSLPVNAMIARISVAPCRTLLVRRLWRPSAAAAWHRPCFHPDAGSNARKSGWQRAGISGRRRASGRDFGGDAGGDGPPAAVARIMNPGADGPRGSGSKPEKRRRTAPGVRFDLGEGLDCARVAAGNGGSCGTNNASSGGSAHRSPRRLRVASAMRCSKLCNRACRGRNGAVAALIAPIGDV